MIMFLLKIFFENYFMAQHDKSIIGLMVLKVLDRDNKQIILQLLNIIKRKEVIYRYLPKTLRVEVKIHFKSKVKKFNDSILMNERCKKIIQFSCLTSTSDSNALHSNTHYSIISKASLLHLKPRQ